MTLPQELRRLYKKGGGWRELFEMLATYSNRVGATTADNAVTYSGLAYETVIACFKELAALKVGEFKFGRRGGKTRLIWHYGPKSVGEVASGAASDLDAYQSEEKLSMDGDEADDEGQEPPAPPALSISDLLTAAKNDLAAKLGLQPEQIEITIKH